MRCWHRSLCNIWKLALACSSKFRNGLACRNSGVNLAFPRLDLGKSRNGRNFFSLSLPRTTKHFTLHPLTTHPPTAHSSYSTYPFNTVQYFNQPFTITMSWIKSFARKAGLAISLQRIPQSTWGPTVLVIKLAMATSPIVLSEYPKRQVQVTNEERIQEERKQRRDQESESWSREELARSRERLMRPRGEFEV